MADVVDAATRSRMMSRIGSKNTKPELRVRRKRQCNDRCRNRHHRDHRHLWHAEHRRHRQLHIHRQCSESDSHSAPGRRNIDRRFQLRAQGSRWPIVNGHPARHRQRHQRRAGWYRQDRDNQRRRQLHVRCNRLRLHRSERLACKHLPISCQMQGSQMPTGQVHHVDVVAHARAVGRGVIIAKH